MKACPWWYRTTFTKTLPRVAHQPTTAPVLHAGAMFSVPSTGISRALIKDYLSSHIARPLHNQAIMQIIISAPPGPWRGPRNSTATARHSPFRAYYSRMRIENYCNQQTVGKAPLHRVCVCGMCCSGRKNENGRMGLWGNFPLPSSIDKNTAPSDSAQPSRERRALPVVLVPHIVSSRSFRNGTQAHETHLKVIEFYCHPPPG